MWKGDLQKSTEYHSVITSSTGCHNGTTGSISSKSHKSSSKQATTKQIVWTTAIIFLTLLIQSSSFLFSSATPLNHQHNSHIPLSYQSTPSLPRRTLRLLSSRQSPISPIPTYKSWGSTVTKGVSHTPAVFQEHPGSYLALLGQQNYGRQVKLQSPVSRPKARPLKVRGRQLRKALRGQVRWPTTNSRRTNGDMRITKSQRLTNRHKQQQHHKVVRSAETGMEKLGEDKLRLDLAKARANINRDYNQNSHAAEDVSKFFEPNYETEKYSLMRELNQTKEKWINPCGHLPHTVMQFDRKLMPVDPVTKTDAELLGNIIVNVNRALRQSRRFKEEYVSTFLDIY